MSGYISSNNNRFYVAMEPQYGSAATLASGNRIPALKLTAKQQLETTNRKDKTGGRTFVGLPSGIRRKTNFDLSTYMTAWSDTTREPQHGPLFQAAFGGTPQVFTGAAVSAVTSGIQVQFSSAHGLSAGQAVKYSGEIRFVNGIVNSQSVVLNAPFSNLPAAGTIFGATITYRPANGLSSASIYDYWSPDTSVHRLLSGAAVNKMRIKVNGDFHEFQFSGQAADLVDSTSFASGQAGLLGFPAEPAIGGFDYSIIPGHLGQVWLGTTPGRFYTLTDAEFNLNNNLDLRNHEFGSPLARAIAPGTRDVSMSFSLYQTDDAATKTLYQAARQRSPISVMIQLGQDDGQLFAINMNSVIPEVPAYDDSENRLQWKFDSSRAQGTIDDEVTIAFG
jgi:hypothetical protein